MMTVPMSNCARFAARPLTSGGTPAPMWMAALDRAPLPALDLSGCPGLVVVAAHPDDETLGLGATIAQLGASGVQVQVVSVSDGGAAQPNATSSGQIRLETTRRHELCRAARVLGFPAPHSLGLPDGRLTDHENAITDSLVDVLEAGGAPPWCAANWRGDGHPDHETVGRAAAAACERTGAMLLEFPIWMWHWADPGDSAVPWDRAHAIHVSDGALLRKRDAARCFRSQFEASPDSPPVLPPFVFPRLMAVGEVVFR
ncbi:PIG-L deacetylase family protein [Mycobacterium sp. Aquia_213]|uniref:PIG-L deacetylase family protein n=1 Tax=Mycobacterium sp. Aquia_213 TaxID=2991728 RepID=UPI00226DAAC4|nr:PIG-L deacetylase family protein [Mycobacterium sp. Aquia_213]WAC90387.1 PIG-L family deacetylase [Mycobacterium sp. Aquia_213]